MQWWGWLEAKRREQGFASNSEVLELSEVDEAEGAPRACLTSSAQISAKDACPPEEQRRRQVCKSRTVLLALARNS